MGGDFDELHPEDEDALTSELDKDRAQDDDGLAAEDEHDFDQPVPEWPGASKATGPSSDPERDEEPEDVVPVDEPRDVTPVVHDITPEDLRILDGAQRDLVAELRDDVLRARAELVNFRSRVERDRQANREAAITEVLRALLPALDDLDRAAAHGDIEDGTPMGIIAMKLRTSLERFGLARFGEKGDPFDPAFHEAIFQQPTPGATAQTVLDVIELGYRFGDRVVRPAKVAVAVPAD